MLAKNCDLISILTSLVLLINVMGAQKTTDLPTPLNKPLKNILTNLNARPSDGDPNKNNTKDWLFKDYLKKYRPVNVWERLNRRKRTQGLNVSMEADFDELFDGIDATDDLLNIKMHDAPESGRRHKWFPPGTLNRHARGKDLFAARRRFFELILHAMYWTRNKLVLMQNFRKKYRRHKLYKMGFLMSKTDIACKTFHRFAYRALHSCIGSRYEYVNRNYPIEILHAEERINYKWFDIELLIDLITQNDESCKKMLSKYDKDRLRAWKFTD